MTWRTKQEAKLKGKRVLVVGAGGIGCELLKNLVLTGFKDIHVIDLDIIDVSNLNRQFLFRREHVGKSKAEVATAAVRNLLPGVSISFDHGSIFDSKFGLTFFKTFDFVMNALDNKAARAHVNRMCLAGRIPLIESGSAGYLGQVTSIVRSQTECYECVDKPATQKTFPGCTIRNTPSEHIHCTVWAKHCFNQLFGTLDIDDDVSPDFNDVENKDPSENTGQNGESSSEKHLSNGVTNGHGEANGSNGTSTEAQSLSTRAWADTVSYNPEKIFDKLFHDDIVYLLQMDRLWKTRRAPVPMKMSELDASGCSTHIGHSVQDTFNIIWSPAQCGEVFAEVVEKLYNRMNALPEKQMTWDKDDDDMMRFVAAAANIRAAIFGIPTKTLFEIKSMAGNIIPAIATTNAMVAGMIVVEAMRVVDGRLEDMRNVFNRLDPDTRQIILVVDVPQKPHPKCLICSDQRECIVKVNFDEMVMKTLQDKVLKSALNMVAPDALDVTTGRQIISSEEGETEAIEMKKLSELSLSDGTTLACSDFNQDLDFKLILVGSKDLKAEEFEVLRNGEIEKKESTDDRKRKISPTPAGEPEVKKIRSDADGDI